MHRTADGYEIHEGDTFWDNNLDLVTITKVAAYSEENRNPDHPDFGQVIYWHDTTNGMADGSRLAKYHPFTQKEAKPSFQGTCQVCLSRDADSVCAHNKSVCGNHPGHNLNDCTTV